MSDQRIKLVQIIADSSLGGGPRHVLDLVKNIDKEKFDVYIICPGGFLSAEAKQVKDVTVYNVQMRSKFDLVALWDIKKIINKIRTEKNPFGPLIIHAHGSRAGLLGRLASPIHAKKVYTEHRFDQDFHLKNPLNEWVQKKLLQIQNFNSDLIIAVSSSVKKYLILSRMAPQEKIVIIPNGVDLAVVGKSVNRLSTDHKAPIIGTIGTLNFQKGHIYLIEAMPYILEKYPLATLEIIGEGEERVVLEAEIKRLNLEKHVTLYGIKSDNTKYMRQWNVFALPSIAETFGIVILEAMSMGLPVVATKVGGIVDIITSKKNGILVEKQNSKQLAKSILEVLDHPVLASKLKREGLVRVKDFDWRDIIKKVEKEYLRLFN